MWNKKIMEVIEAKDISGFGKVWAEESNNLTERDKQNLMTNIIDCYYKEKDFAFYVKVFDRIIESKVSLDFNIEHWAPTFLSLVVFKASRQLFDYFLRKGASLNFVGDKFAFETAENMKRAMEITGSERYATCLDFALLKLSDHLTVDYNYDVPEIEEQINSWTEVDEKEEVTIPKRDYYYLIEQAQYLHDLIHTDRLVEHIKSLGGKEYLELKGDS